MLKAALVASLPIRPVALVVTHEAIVAKYHPVLLFQALNSSKVRPPVRDVIVPLLSHYWPGTPVLDDEDQWTGLETHQLAYLDAFLCDVDTHIITQNVSPDLQKTNHAILDARALLMLIGKATT